MPMVEIDFVSPEAAAWAASHPDEITAWAAARAAEDVGSRIEDAAGWHASLAGEDAVALAAFESTDDGWADDDTGLRQPVNE